MSAPTPRGRELLGFIDRFERSKSYAPTLFEMAESLRVSRTRVKQLVEDLVEKKLVEHDAGKARTVRLTPAGAQALKKAA